jgi:hypothetical protein
MTGRQEAMKARLHMAVAALDDMLEWLRDGGGRVAMYAALCVVSLHIVTNMSMYTEHRISVLTRNAATTGRT